MQLLLVDVKIKMVIFSLNFFLFITFLMFYYYFFTILNIIPHNWTVIIAWSNSLSQSLTNSSIYQNGFNQINKELVFQVSFCWINGIELDFVLFIKKNKKIILVWFRLINMRWPNPSYIIYILKIHIVIVAFTLYLFNDLPNPILD